MEISQSIWSTKGVAETRKATQNNRSFCLLVSKEKNGEGFLTWAIGRARDFLAGWGSSEYLSTGCIPHLALPRLALGRRIRGGRRGVGDLRLLCAGSCAPRYCLLLVLYSASSFFFYLSYINLSCLSRTASGSRPPPARILRAAPPSARPTSHVRPRFRNHP